MRKLRGIPFEKFFVKLSQIGIPYLSDAGYYFRVQRGYFVFIPYWRWYGKHYITYTVAGGLSKESSLEDWSRLIALVEGVGLAMKEHDPELMEKAHRFVIEDYKDEDKEERFSILAFFLIDHFLKEGREWAKQTWQEAKRNNFVFPPEPEIEKKEETVIQGFSLYRWESEEWLIRLEYLLLVGYYSCLYKLRPWEVSQIAGSAAVSGLTLKTERVREYLSRIIQNNSYREKFIQELENLRDTKELLDEVAVALNYV